MDYRELGLKILEQIYEDSAYSNLAIKENIGELSNKKQENILRELVYGSLEKDIYLEYIIKKNSKIKLKKIHPKILIILKMSLYQILFLDSIPDSAAVNEAVNLTKKYGHKGSVAFVNGILRNIVRNKDLLSKVTIEDKAHRLSVEESIPLWMVEKFIRDFGYDFTKDLVRGFNQKIDLTLRYNKTKTDYDELFKDLDELGFRPERPRYSKSGILLKSPRSLEKTSAYKEGKFYIQGEASMLVGELLNPRPGSKLIDLCSAPGGKASHLAELMHNKGDLLACDLYDHRLDLIKDNSQRLGLDIIRTLKMDAKVFRDDLYKSFDYCLIDAPCSGLGLIHKRPEMRINKKESSIKDLSDIQYEIITNGSKYLKDGATMVYSTCTISKEENEEVIYRFLRENPNFRLVDFSLGINKDLKSEDGMLRLYPHINKTDGFFMCKLIKEDR